jgi:hypothetical protein
VLFVGTDGGSIRKACEKFVRSAASLLTCVLAKSNNGSHVAGGAGGGDMKSDAAKKLAESVQLPDFFNMADPR